VREPTPQITQRRLTLAWGSACQAEPVTGPAAILMTFRADIDGAQQSRRQADLPARMANACLAKP
jgi:hypothetical protein